MTPDTDPTRTEEEAVPTEGQTVPPEEETVPSGGGTIPAQEQILPSGGGSMPAPEAQTQDEPAQEGGGSQGKAEEMKGQAAEKAAEMADKVKEAAPESMGAAAGQAQSLAREKPVPIALAGAFVAGVVVGRIASRR
ncbi:MAG TPA: hypothetical protein VGV69_04970 [Solirubrobacterales bacterium]|nr:hypothetical protein [Solirubrobacterales bacterium]